MEDGSLPEVPITRPRWWQDRRWTTDSVLLCVVAGLALYAITRLQLGAVLITLRAGHGIHTGDLVVLLVALPSLVVLGRRIVLRRNQGSPH